MDAEHLLAVTPRKNIYQRSFVTNCNGVQVLIQDGDNIEPYSILLNSQKQAGKSSSSAASSGAEESKSEDTVLSKALSNEDSSPELSPYSQLTLQVCM